MRVPPSGGLHLLDPAELTSSTTRDGWDLMRVLLPLEGAELPDRASGPSFRAYLLWRWRSGDPNILRSNTQKMSQYAESQSSQGTLAKLPPPPSPFARTPPHPAPPPAAPRVRRSPAARGGRAWPAALPAPWRRVERRTSHLALWWNKTRLVRRR